LTDPRECPAGVEPACPAWEAGASAARPRARRKSGRGGSRTLKACARPFSRRVPSPVGSPFRFKAPAAGIEPASPRLTAECSYQHEPHRIRTGALLVPNQADCQAFPHPGPKCPAGVEPAHPPWQGGRLPLHHGHEEPTPDCQRRAPGGTRTHVAALRKRCPCRWTTSASTEWDPRGSNPHLPG
jgi:hypothetical protein